MGTYFNLDIIFDGLLFGSAPTITGLNLKMRMDARRISDGALVFLKKADPSRTSNQELKMGLIFPVNHSRQTPKTTTFRNTKHQHRQK
ncbi:hypothetical protein WG66_008348 [Moniliophthora roreri]|nr:hypothetical protein WG66_008348 [Moniliophthora roreri]